MPLTCVKVPNIICTHNVKKSNLSITNKWGINQGLNLDTQHYAGITCCTEAKEDKGGPYQRFDLDLET